jgi:hypothetical protein
MKQLFNHLNIDNYTVETSSTRSVYKIKWAGDRKSLLNDIEAFLKTFKFPYQRHQFSHYSSVGHIQWEDNFFVVKPLKGATENLQIKASTLASQGTLEVLDLFGEKDVECYTFKTARQLQDSIYKTLSDNPNVSNRILESINMFFVSSVLKWHPDILSSEKNELGKYLGEVLIGYLALAGELDAPFLNGKAKKFIIPVSSCFSGVDCAIITKNDELIPISNKFGIGAKASFFSNLLPTILAFEKKIPRGASVLRNIVAIAKLFPNPERKAKEIVYEYGCRHVLKIPVVDSYQVYRDIVAEKITKPTKTVLKQIGHVASPTVKAFLKKSKHFSSVTGFFCRRFATDLNENESSLEFLKELLAKKDFYQANLNIAKWLKGTIEYSFTQSGEIDLTFIGVKSSLSDIAAKQGLVNYQIKTL